MKTKKCILGILFSFALVLGMALAGGSPAYAAQTDAGDGGTNSPISVPQARGQNPQSYFVQFQYDGDKYVMQGDNTVPLSEILNALHLSGKVTQVEFDTSGLSAQHEDGTWMVTSNQKFDSTKSMYVTIGGKCQQVYVNTESFYVQDASSQDLRPNGAVTILYPGGTQSFKMVSTTSDLPLQWIITADNWYTIRPWTVEIASNGHMTVSGSGRLGMRGSYSLDYKYDQDLHSGNNAWIIDHANISAWRLSQWKLNEPTYRLTDNLKIVYDGEIHSLIKATGASGPRHYRYKKTDAGWSEWSTEVPTASEVGTYQVQWYSEIGYEWLSKGSAESPAGEATATITTSVAVAPSLTGYPYYYDGSEHGVTAKGASGGTVYYRTSTDNESWTSWSEWTDLQTTSVGKRTNAGVTYVQAYTKGDNDHADSGVVTEVVNIQKADPQPTYQESLSATYGQTLADVHLTSTGNVPGKWAWRDADTTSVGNAGVHNPEATFTPEDATNYKTVGTSVRFTVYKANNLASVADEAYVTKDRQTVDLADNVWLNGAAGAVSYAFDGDNSIGCSLSGSVLTSGDTEGTVKVKVTVAGDDNHNELVVPVSVTVTGKNRQTIVANDVDVTYGDTDRNVAALVTNPEQGGGAISYSVKPGSEKYIAVDATSGKLTIMEVPADGKAYVTATAEETGEYVRTTKLVTVNVAKADTVAATVTANDRTNNGTAQPLVIVKDLAPAKGTMLYALGADAATAPEATAFSANIPTAIDAGTYYVWYKVAGDANHNDTEPVCVSVKIDKANAVSATVTANYCTYDGTAQPLVTVTGEAVGGTMYYAVTTENKAPTNDSLYTTSIPTATNAGTYYVWYKVKGDDNHYPTDPAVVSATIGERDVLIKGLGAMDKIYDDTTTATISGTASLDNKIASDDVSIQAGNAAFDSADAGENRTVTFTGYSLIGEAAGNYNLVSQPDPVTAKIEKRPVKITANEQTVPVGDAIAEMEVSTETGTDKGILKDRGHVLAEVTLTPDPDPRSSDHLTDTGTIAATGAVIKKDNTDVTANYVITYQDGQLNITKGYQTITAENVTVTYGDTDKKVVASVTRPATGGGSISYAVKDGSADYIEVNASTGALTIKKVPVDGKAYVVVTASGTAIYEQAPKEVTVTINKANAVPATVSANNRTYDGTQKPLVTVDNSTLMGGTMYYALGENADTAPDFDGTSQSESKKWTTSIPAETNAGTYYVWYKVVATNENYKDKDPVYVTVTIKKKPAPVTPSKFTVTFIVVNGAWDDESSTTKTVTTDKLTASQIPGVGNMPDEGYMAGSWNKTPSTSITGSTTYIYTYAEKPLPEIITEPTGKDLTETGDEQELITAGTATGGTLQYTLGASDGTYSSSIPKAIDAGTYYVWYIVVGDEEHRSTDPTSIEVTIKENTKPAASITKAPEGKDLTANGEAQELVYAGEVSGGTMEYDVGITRPSSFSNSIPTATAAGTYTVWYRAKGDEESTMVKSKIW